MTHFIASTNPNTNMKLTAEIVQLDTAETRQVSDDKFITTSPPFQFSSTANTNTMTVYTLQIYYTNVGRR